MTQNDDRDDSDIEVNRSRIRDTAGCIGTVRYVGAVRSCSRYPNRQYAGVEWDNPSRGKHNGSVLCRQTNEIVAHFVVAHATGASFVPLSKIDTGVTLSKDLLRERYVAMDSQEIIAPNNVLPHSVRTALGRSKPVEFIGEISIRKRQQLEDLSTISLRRMGINRIPLDCLEANQFHITSMDLAGNLLCHWKDVLNLLQLLPQLLSLNLASNRLLDFELVDIERLQEMEMHGLQKLNLRETGLTKVSTVSEMTRTILPEVKEMCLAGCHFLDMDATVQWPLQSLQVLDMSECHLDSSQLPMLQNLPMLERLVLDDNPLQEWPVFDEGVLEHLLHVQLCNVPVNDWLAIEPLNSLPKLSSLRLSCPLTEELGTASGRSLIIARFEKLIMVNGSSVSSDERIEAERRYVSRLATTFQSPGGEEKEQLHPQWARLKAKHNTLVDRVQSVSNGQGLAGPTMHVLDCTIESLMPTSCDESPLIRRFPTTMKVDRILTLAARHFGHDVQDLALYAVTDSLPLPLDDTSRSLEYYAFLSNPVRLQVQERLVETNAPNDPDWEQRMEQQEATMQTLHKAKQQQH